MTFREFIASTSDASVAAVLTQLLQLHAAYTITCQAADFIEVCYRGLPMTVLLLSTKALLSTAATAVY